MSEEESEDYHHDLSDCEEPELCFDSQTKGRDSFPYKHQSQDLYSHQSGYLDSLQCSRPRFWWWWSPTCLVQISSKKRKIVSDKGLLLYAVNLQQLEQFIKANVYTGGEELLQKYFHKNSHQS